MNDDPKELKTTLGLILIAATVAVYWQVSSHEFLNYDDQLFVYANSHVHTGVTIENLKWAFSTLHGNASYWHPLTWISHQLDCQLFGLHAGAHHLTNLCLHAANTILLFGVLHTLTRNLWPSFWVAALFALHPLHIETVAWVSERKSLLCSFLWLLTIWAYVRYARRPTLLAYLPVVVFCAASLMSKPMAVTLPFTLLLLDFWPLGRFEKPLTRPHGCVTTLSPAGGEGWGEGAVGRATTLRLMAEKLPLFALAALVSGLTIVAQKTLGAMRTLEALPLDVRVGNAVVAYGVYIRKMIWPADLAVIYPLRGDWQWWQVAGCAIFLCSISWVVLQFASSRPYLLFGWSWYVGTLVPMIGLVQVGSQAMADRYTYIPLIGLFISLVWGLSDFAEAVPRRKQMVAVGTSLFIAVFGLASAVQLGHWKNSIRLFEHAIGVGNDNHIAHQLLGLAFQNQRNLDKAEFHLAEGLKIRPGEYLYHRGLAGVLFQKGDLKGAFEHYTVALKLQPTDAEAHAGLANFFLNATNSAFHHPEKAVFHSERACELTHYRQRKSLIFLARIYAKTGRYQKATDAARKAIDVSVGSREINGSRDLLMRIEKMEAQARNDSAHLLGGRATIRDR